MIIQPTNSTPPSGDQTLWASGQHSRGMQKVNKSMAKLGMNTQTGIMRREYGMNLTPLQKAWKPTPQ